MLPAKKSLATGTILTAITILAIAIGIIAFVLYVNGADTNTGSLVTNATLAVVSMLSLAILAISVFKNWEMAEAARRSAQVAADTLLEMRDVRDGETAPYVIVYFDVPYGEGNIHLVVKNIGKTEAKDVTFAVNPPLASTWPVFQEFQFEFLTRGTRSIPPGYEIRTFYDDTRTYFGRRQPFTYTVTVSYFGGLKSEKRISEQVLDLTPYHYQASPHEKDMDDLVKQVEMLNKIQSNIVEALSDLTDTLKEIAKPKEPSQIAQLKDDHEDAIPSDKEPPNEPTEPAS